MIVCESPHVSQVLGVVVGLVVGEGPQQFHQVLVVQHLLFQQSLGQLATGEDCGCGQRWGFTFSKRWLFFLSTASA